MEVVLIRAKYPRFRKEADAKIAQLNDLKETDTASFQKQQSQMLQEMIN